MFEKITHTYRQRLRLAAIVSVARVRPRTSKGITDLLLPSLRWLTPTVPLRSQARSVIRVTI